jgi:hypothetical protein
MRCLHISPSPKKSVIAIKAICCCVAVLVFLLALPALATVRNVQTYGAVGDGTKDDTSFINLAITALADGDELYFPCGSYIIMGALTPISLTSVTVTGPNTNCVTIKLTGSGSFTALRLSGGPLTASQRLIADTTANTFTVTRGGLAAIGIAAGSYVQVSDAGVSSNGTNSPQISNQEIVKVVGISGDTATIEGTFSHDFTLISPYPALQGGNPIVQTIAQPTTATVQYLAFDGSANTGSSIALRLNYAINSEVGFVTAARFLGTGNSGGILVDSGYHNNVHDIVCNACGNGGASASEALTIQRQSFATVQNVSIVQTASQSVFSFSLRQVHWSTVSHVTVDAGGANGRPVKLLRASHNTINSITAKNGTGSHNGISVTDVSQYNTFNDCVAINNSNVGILLFGNHNEHNTFNNCTSTGNQSWQFGQTNSADGTYTDYFTTINGGQFCCGNGGSAIIENNSDNFVLAGATVFGSAANGVVTNRANVVIQNNTFSGLPAGRDVYAVGSTNLQFCGNVTPDGTTPVSIPTGACQSTKPAPPTELTVTSIN